MTQMLALAMKGRCASNTHRPDASGKLSRRWIGLCLTRVATPATTDDDRQMALFLRFAKRPICAWPWQ